LKVTVKKPDPMPL